MFHLYPDHKTGCLPASFAEGLNTYDIDLKHRFPAGERNDVIWGLGYRLRDVTVANSATLAFLPPHKTRQKFSDFAQDEIALVKDRLHLTLGAKIEHNEYTGFEYQPSGRLAWKVTQRQTVWGAISRAVRTPSRIDNDFFVPGSPPFTFLQGGANFVSEE